MQWILAGSMSKQTQVGFCHNFAQFGHPNRARTAGFCLRCRLRNKKPGRPILRPLGTPLGQLVRSTNFVFCGRPVQATAGQTGISPTVLHSSNRAQKSWNPLPAKRMLMGIEPRTIDNVRSGPRLDSSSGQPTSFFVADRCRQQPGKRAYHRQCCIHRIGLGCCPHPGWSVPE